MKKQFLYGVLAILFIYSASTWGISKLADLNTFQISGFILSGIIATINIVAAFRIIKWALTKEANDFYKFFLKGLAARLFVLLTVIFILIKYSRVDNLAFLASFFILYFLYQIWELIIISVEEKKGT